MEKSVKVKCPECKGSGVDASDHPVVFVMTWDKESGMTEETPCFMCFGHGYIVAVDPIPK